MIADVSELQIIHYPDPRLRKPARTVEKFNKQLSALAERMFELMAEHKGVGLAAPQVGVMLRLFVMNLTGEPADRMVFANPVIRDGQGTRAAEEGCLSIPGIEINVRRSARCRLTAQDLEGKPVEMDGEDLLCRVWQHETDHLNGILILDRMGPSERISTRKTLRDLELTYKNKNGG